MTDQELDKRLSNIEYNLEYTKKTCAKVEWILEGMVAALIFAGFVMLVSKLIH
jgi:hypothetical protein